MCCRPEATRTKRCAVGQLLAMCCRFAPWLLMDHCKECFRETVFLYDRLDEAGAVVREYPTNHVQVRSVDLPPDLLALIQ